MLKSPLNVVISLTISVTKQCQHILWFRECCIIFCYLYYQALIAYSQVQRMLHHQPCNNIFCLGSQWWWCKTVSTWSKVMCAAVDDTSVVAVCLRNYQSNSWNYTLVKKSLLQVKFIVTLYVESAWKCGVQMTSRFSNTVAHFRKTASGIEC